MNGKLSPWLYGLYQVLGKYGDLPATTKIHVFHVSQLKKSLQAAASVQQIPLALTEEFELQVQLEESEGEKNDRWEVGDAN